MKVITLEDYFMGREKTYAKELTDDIKQNAVETVECTNKLLQFMHDDGVDTTKIAINSGWRPKSINAATKGADPNSTHITCQAVDLRDNNKLLKEWIGKNPSKVKQSGFAAVEDFSITSTWAHLQTIEKKFSWQKGKVLWIPFDGEWKNIFSNEIRSILVP